MFTILTVYYIFQYYCEQCWANIHSRPGREFHKPLVKEGADRPRTVPFRWCWKNGPQPPDQTNNCKSNTQFINVSSIWSLFWIFTGHYFLNNALVIDDLLCSEQRWKKRANHVCQKWDSFRALLLLEKKWILNGMMASSSVVHSKVRKYCYLKWSCKRLKNRSLESNFGQKNLHFNCWLSSKHQQRRCFKC